MVVASWPVTIQSNDELAAYGEPAGHIATRGNDLGPHWWRLTAGVLVRLQIAEGATVEVVAPRMYTWDGASIPRPLWRIIGKPLDPRFALASLVHDWICEHAETRPQRVFGDAVFLWLLRDAGVAPWRHYAMWLAVSAWRRFIWKAKR